MTRPRTRCEDERVVQWNAPACPRQLRMNLMVPADQVPTSVDVRCGCAAHRSPQADRVCRARIRALQEPEAQAIAVGRIGTIGAAWLAVILDVHTEEDAPRRAVTVDHSIVTTPEKQIALSGARRGSGPQIRSPGLHRPSVTVPEPGSPAHEKRSAPPVFVATNSTRNGSAGIPSCVFQPMHEVPSSLFVTNPTSTKHRFPVTPATARHAAFGSVVSPF